MISIAGYSQKSLRDKLDIKPGMRLYFHNAPAEVLAELGDLEEVTSLVHDPELATFFHYFITTRSQLFKVAEQFQHLKAPNQILWVSWPKKASKVQTDITEQDLRDALLPIGMVDVKVCAVSDIYSGLKFVWRKK
jgi:hypothetical protein